MSFSHRIARVQPSATLAVSAKAQQLKAEGRDIIGLGTGEPDFDTPAFIAEAAIAAIRAGETRYTAVDGTQALKEAIVDDFQTRHQLTYKPSEILVSSGAKQSLFNLTQALLNAGDEVIIPAPYWVSYPAMVKLADATPVIIPTTLAQHYKITPEQLEEAITPQTKLFFLNSPSNPSGMAYSHQALLALAEVLMRHPHVWVVTDDIYEHIYWGKDPFQTLLRLAPELRDRTVTVNGVSKAYAMTGWRIGYAAGPKNLIAGMKKIQSQSTSNPCSIAQAAALAALTGPQDCIQEMGKAFRERHDFVYERLSAMPAVDVLPSDGTFYTFPSIERWINDNPFGIEDDTAFATHLLETQGLAVVPGSAFGVTNSLRLSYAADMSTLEAALNRLRSALSA